jgi:glycosyltransferase involved in cell wall biosynthesis
MYQSRYPELAEEKCLLLPNGYDEEDFLDLLAPSPPRVPRGQTFQLLHSGLVYPEERDPRPFFRALARLKQEGKIDGKSLSVNFRAPGSEQIYLRAITDLGIADVLHLTERIPYTAALQEYIESDALLLMQAKNCDHQIPAKMYEYFRLGKPILALTTESGDTASVLRKVGGATIVDLADEQAIYRALPEFIESVNQGQHPLPSQALVMRYSRRNLTEELANHLDRLEAPAHLQAVEKPTDGVF